MTEEQEIKIESDESTTGEISFDDALILGKFDIAEQRLNEFKKKYGETVTYIFKSGQLKWKQGRIKEAYSIFKSLFFEAPVYMKDKSEYRDIRKSAIISELEKAQALWNKISIDTINFYKENPGVDLKEDSEPHIKEFYLKRLDEIKKVEEIFLNILQIEEYEKEAVEGLIDCYKELKEKLKIKSFQDKLNDCEYYWKHMIRKRTDAVLKAKNKQEESKRYELAIKIINLGLETDPENDVLLTAKANNLQNLGRYDEALACVKAALKINPRNPNAARLKRVIESQKFMYNLKIGLDLISRADSLDAGSHEQQRKLESALSYLLEALSYDNANLTALAGIYKCHMKMGNPIKAQRALERIRDIDPMFDVNSVFVEVTPKRPAGQEACFVATRLYGEYHYNTNCLRHYRDTVLKKYLLGKIFIKLYYRIGPVLASVSEKSLLIPIFKMIIEKIILPFIKK